MIVVGELINGSREAIARAMAQHDAQAILNVAREQAAAGAHILDVNAGTTPDREAEDLVWLVDVILSELDTPLCIDSPHAEAMEAGLKKAGDQAVLVNSITGEKSRLESFLPLIKSHRTKIIALCMGDKGVPKEAQERLRTATDLVEKLTGQGIEPDRIFLDPIVCPISVDDQAGLVALETLRLIKKNIPQAKTICGLSNISFGLPNRRLLNRNLLSLMLAAGLDAAIMDPTDKNLMADLVATQVLLGQDGHCLGYINAARDGKII